MSNLIEEAIREHWGERCPDFDPGCLGCLAWKAVDELASLRSDNECLRAALRGLIGAVADHTSQKSIPQALTEARAAYEEAAHDRQV